ncbi:MAG: hypothetical protein J6U23_01145 [Clostridiales bacterium]|nr:hypothetical protein [Clostridiales bacterium]
MFRKLKRSDDNNLYPLDMVLAFILPLLIFGCAYYLGIRDTKIPQELTLRYDKFDMGIFRGITDDLKLIKSFSLEKDFRLVLQGHLDPGFLMASYLPFEFASVILYVFFFLRLALASFSMHRFLRRQVPLDRSLTLLLSVCYSLSSAVLGIASFSGAMNTVIAIPFMIDLLIEFMRDDHSVRKGLHFSLSLTLLFYLSGNLNLMTVLPFALFTSFFIASAVGTKFSNSVILFLKSLPYFLFAIGFSAFTFANTILDSEIPFPLDADPDLDSRASMFDLLTRFLNGKPYNMSIASGVGLSLTIFILLLLIVFFFNPRIPIRIRAVLFFGLFICFAMYCSNLLLQYGTLFTNAVLDCNSTFTARFAFLSSLLIFAAAISLRNLASVKNSTVAFSVLSVLILVVLSNSSGNSVSPSLFSMAFTILCAVLGYFMIVNIDKIPGYVTAAAVLLGLTLNLSFILPISHYGKPTDDAAMMFDGIPDEDLSLDYPLPQLDFFSRDNEDFYFLSHFHPDYNSTPGMLNTLTYYMGIEPFFMPLSQANDVFRGRGDRLLIGEEPMMEDGMEVVSYKIITLDFWEKDDPLMLYTDYKGEFDFVIEHGDIEDRQTLTGPCMVLLDNKGEDSFGAKILIDDPKYKHNSRFEYYSVNEEALEDFRMNALRYDGPFNVEGSVTVLTGRRYGSPVSVYVNDEKVVTYNIAGKLAFDTYTDGTAYIEIRSFDYGIYISAVVVLISIICSIVVILLSDRKEKKKKA